MSKSLKILLVILLILGLLFRFLNLEKKVYWHDEVYTTIRATGNTMTSFYENEFQSKLVSIEQLQKYQQLKDNSSDLDTVISLVNEDPHHPPLYFLLNRYWGKLFGYSITSSRILPILISLLSIPSMYLLGVELFNSRIAGIFAALFLLFSPFDIIFSQIARQYSLVTLLIILSSFLLLKSVKYTKIRNWIFYVFVALLGWYTHLFFILTILAHGIFIIVAKRFKKILPFTLSLVTITILYLPWLMVILVNRETVIGSTNWTKSKFDLIIYSKQWILSFSSLLTDLFFGFDNPLTYYYRLFFIALIAWAIYTVYKARDLLVSSFILSSALVPFLLLFIVDIISSTLLSTVNRYLIFCYPGVQLSLAYLFYKNQHKRIWQFILALILTNSLVLGAITAYSDTSIEKVTSYFNKEITRIINQSPGATIVSDRGDEWTNSANLISLSYHLDKDHRFILASYPAKEETILDLINTSKVDIFVFKPSEALKIMLEKNYSLLEPINLEAGLYKIKR